MPDPLVPPPEPPAPPPDPSIAPPPAPSGGPQSLLDVKLDAPFPDDFSDVDLSKGRPEFVPERFWKPGEDDTQPGTIRALEAVKSAVTFEKKFRAGEKPNAAPESVDAFFAPGDLFNKEGFIVIGEGDDAVNISKDDELMQHAAQSAMEAGDVSVASFNKIIGDYLTKAVAIEQQRNLDYTNEQVALMGADAPSLQITNTTFLTHLKDTGVIDDAGLDFATNVLLSSAAGMQFLNALRGTSLPAPTLPIPPDAKSVITGPLAPYNATELRERVDNSLYQSDPDYRKATDDGYAALYGTGINTGDMPVPKARTET